MAVSRQIPSTPFRALLLHELSLTAGCLESSLGGVLCESASRLGAGQRPGRVRGLSMHNDFGNAASMAPERRSWLVQTTQAAPIEPRRSREGSILQRLLSPSRPTPSEYAAERLARVSRTLNRVGRPIGSYRLGESQAAREAA